FDVATAIKLRVNAITTVTGIIIIDRCVSQDVNLAADDKHSGIPHVELAAIHPESRDVHDAIDRNVGVLLETELADERAGARIDIPNAIAIESELPAREVSDDGAVWGTLAGAWQNFVGIAGGLSGRIGGGIQIAPVGVTARGICADVPIVARGFQIGH